VEAKSEHILISINFEKKKMAMILLQDSTSPN